MLVSPLLDSSGADKGPQFAVGEVANGEYRVRAVEEDEQGRIIHKCSRLSNGENVVLRYESHNDQLSAWPSYQNSPVVPSVRGMLPAGRFAVQFGNDLFIYGVYKERMMKDLYQRKADFERARSIEAQRRPGPAGARSVVYRKGDCQLEVDIPANGCDGNEACGIGSALLVGTFAAVFACLAVPVAFSFDVGAGILSLVFVGLIGFAACSAAFRTIATVFKHENLTITPSDFEIKSVLELEPSERDSVNNARVASEELTCLDNLLCQQVSGDTRNLWQAKIRVDRNSDDDSTKRYLVLIEGVEEHTLGDSLSDAEKEWIAEEVNEVLENIKQGAGAV